MMNDPMDRRTFLQWLTAVAVAPILRQLEQLGISDGQRDGSTVAIAQRLIQAVDHRGSARAVGRAYVATRPPERTLQRVLTALTADRFPPRMVLRADPQTLRVRVREALRDDFARGRTVSVHGWVLSLTEARLCALVALWNVGNRRRPTVMGL